MTNLEPVDESSEAAVSVEANHVEIGNQINNTHRTRHELKHQHSAPLRNRKHTTRLLKQNT